MELKIQISFNKEIRMFINLQFIFLYLSLLSAIKKFLKFILRFKSYFGILTVNSHLYLFLSNYFRHFKYFKPC